MYIHYGETQQPYKREIKNCPNLILYTLFEQLSFICLIVNTSQQCVVSQSPKPGQRSLNVVHSYYSYTICFLNLDHFQL